MPIKQVIVMRKDLNMRKGKIAAQAGHACVAALIKAASVNNSYLNWNFKEDKIECIGKNNRYIDDWLNNNFTKICVYVESEEELLKIKEQGDKLHLISAIITDNGLTEFHGQKTLTCLAFEPLPSEIIDKITGNLKLY